MALGVYPDKEIAKMIREGKIVSDVEITTEQIQPASLDLRLGDEAICVPFSFNPEVRGNLRDFLDTRGHYKISLDDKRLFHRGQVYVVKMLERVSLPEHVEARANPKSSTGRVDIHVRQLAEGIPRLDVLPRGYSGEIWLEVCPRSFDVYVTRGVSLNQLRLFDAGTETVGDEELAKLQREKGILFRNGKKVRDFESVVQSGKIPLTIDLKSRRTVGYKARAFSDKIDLGKRGHPRLDYFEPVSAKNGELVIPPGAFFILSSLERIIVPPMYCSEMVDIDTTYGELRTHYAGFFDPGFGMTEERELGCNITMEVRNFGFTPVLVRHGQPLGCFSLYRMNEQPEKLYGTGSHYAKQAGPTLGKYFS